MAPLNVSGNWSHAEAAHSLGTQESCTGRHGPQTPQTSCASHLHLACVSPVKALIPPGALDNDAKGGGGNTSRLGTQTSNYAVTRGYLIDKL